MIPESESYRKELHPAPLPSQHTQEGTISARGTSPHEMRSSESRNDEERSYKSEAVSEGARESSVMWMQFPTHSNRPAPFSGTGGGEPLDERPWSASPGDLGSFSPSLHQPSKEQESKTPQSVQPEFSAAHSESIPACSLQVDRRSEQLGMSVNSQGNLVPSSAPDGLRELSAGLTFRRTTRGYYLYWSDNQELVFLDETNTLHKLGDGYDTEDLTTQLGERVSSGLSETADFRDKNAGREKKKSESMERRENSEPNARLFYAADIDEDARKEAESIHQLELLIAKQLELLNHQCQQYQQYMQQVQQYPHPQQQQQLHEQYRPTEQHLTAQQLEVLQHMRKAMDAQHAEQSGSCIVLLDKVVHHIQQPHSPGQCPLQKVLSYLREKKAPLPALFQQAENELTSCAYPPIHGNDVNIFQQHLQKLYQGQYHSWSQLLQAIREQRQLVENLQQECLSCNALRQGHEENQFQQPNAQIQDQWEQYPPLAPAPQFSPHSENSTPSTSQLRGNSEKMGGIHQLQNLAQNPILSSKTSVHGNGSMLPAMNEAPNSSAIPDPQLQQQRQGVNPSLSLSGPSLQPNPSVSPLSGASFSISHLPSGRPQFSGRFDSQRRPIYVDPNGSYFRLNASRQPEYISDNELDSLALSRK